MSRKILVFTNRDDAVYTERAFWELLFVPRLRSEGYQIVVGEDGHFSVVGKNAGTGLDEPDAAHSLRWDVVEELGDGRYFIGSPAERAQFSGFEYDLRELGVSITFTKEILPADWRCRPGQP